jgi:hypothetical protein
MMMRVVMSVLGSSLRRMRMLWMTLSWCSMCQARVYRALSAPEAMTFSLDILLGPKANNDYSACVSYVLCSCSARSP